MKVGDIVTHPEHGPSTSLLIVAVSGTDHFVVRPMFVANAPEFTYRPETLTLVAESMMESGSVEDDEDDAMVAALNDALGSIDEAMEAMKEARRLVEDCVPRYA